MMDRRKFLTTGTALCFAAITGCTSGAGISSSQDQEQAREHLDNAATALERAGEEMVAESEKFTESDFQAGSVDIKTATINGYLDTASTELDNAEEYATEDQRELIDAVRGYIVFAREAVEFFDVFAEGYSQAYSGFTYIQSERYEAAVGELESAEATLADADDRLTLTQSRFEELDTDILSDIEEVEITALQSSLDDLDGLVPAFQAMVRGMRLISDGMIDFSQGATQVDNSQYAEAESSFRAASEDFNAARSTFQAEEARAPTEIKTTFIQMTCFSGALRDASRHLADSMEAYRNGDYSRSESEARAASEALERCDFSA